ncbi:penicillin-binding protein 2 [Bacillus timonensis]|nr:penicillin-binding protein 2 [Bacillus timonensis]
MVIRKRMILVLTFILFLFTGLIARLIHIQLVSTEHFSKENVNLINASVSQRTQELVIDQGRGRFIDRYDKSLTHEYLPNLVLFPFLKTISWPIEEVASILNVPSDQLKEEINIAKGPIVFGGKKPVELTETQLSKINQLKIPGVIAVHRQYEVEHKLAEHVIGLIRENESLLRERYPEKPYLSNKTLVGITGLQATFDEFLLPEGEKKLLYHVAGDGSPLFGINVKYSGPANPFYPVAVKTTIDKEIQKISESIIKKHNLKKGGLVILDVETSDVLAMVSMPSINHNNPFADSGGQNQILQSHFPGSIFKTVIAAAAIEKNIKLNNRTFNCDLDQDGEGEAVYKNGELDFKSSFAKSCNYTFGTIAKELMDIDSSVIENYAKKLGLIGPVSWNGNVFRIQNFSQIPNEYKGRVWGDDRNKSVNKAITQTAIGQLDVRVTPLAVANMMATIARGGEKDQVRLATEVQYKNGTSLFSFPHQELQGEKLAPYTSIKLQELLREVVKTGTGNKFNTLPYKVAGKSGTAETGKVGLDNKWFAGYFPIEDPKYALVVVDIEQEKINHKSYEVFYEVVKELYELDKSRIKQEVE